MQFISRGPFTKDVSKMFRVNLCKTFSAFNHFCLHCGPKNCHPFSFHYSFYKCWPISIIFFTHYTELIWNITIIDLPTSPTYCCCTTLQKKSVAKIITLPKKLHFLLFRRIKHPVYPHNQSALSALNPKYHTKCSKCHPFSSSFEVSCAIRQQHRPQCFAISHSKCQSSAVSDRPLSELMPNARDSASRPIFHSQLD